VSWLARTPTTAAIKNIYDETIQKKGTPKLLKLKAMNYVALYVQINTFGLDMHN